MKFENEQPRWTTPRPAFGSDVQHRQTAPALGPTTRATIRHARAAKTAAELLPELPRLGESVHALMLGFFDLAQVITATVARVPECRHVRIATLCFAKRNVADIVGMLAARPEMKFTLLVSVFFRDHNKDLYEAAAEQIAGQGGRLAAARSHAKVCCIDSGPDDGIVFEGSANLRTNRNREQLAVIRDRALHDWHAAWIDQLAHQHG